jgi:hypothetical protein
MWFDMFHTVQKPTFPVFYVCKLNEYTAIYVKELIKHRLLEDLSM